MVDAFETLDRGAYLRSPDTHNYIDFVTNDHIQFRDFLHCFFAENCDRDLLSSSLVFK